YTEFMSTLIHVAYLQPEQQAALRIMLFNLHLLQCQKWLQDVQESPLNETIHTRMNYMSGALERYTGLAHGFPSLETYRRAKANVFYFNPSGFKHIVVAIETYSETSRFLDAAEVQLVSMVYAGLKKLIDESMKHQYTEEEVKLMIKGSRG
ncbi:MAG: hypothetical protein ACREGB_01750, partial [Candidatus Saccharimonadales bacterium]